MSEFTTQTRVTDQEASRFSTTRKITAGISQVKILTSPICGYCDKAKQLLQQQGIAYQEVDIRNGTEQAQHLLTQSRKRTVPQIFVNEKLIGGFFELSQLLGNRGFGLNHIHSLT